MKRALPYCAVSGMAVCHVYNPELGEVLRHAGIALLTHCQRRRDRFPAFDTPPNDKPGCVFLDNVTVALNQRPDLRAIRKKSERA